MEIRNWLKDFTEVANKLCGESIEEAIEVLFSAWKNNRTVFLMGNGGSASTATHFAADLAKTANVEGKKRFKAISLNDNAPLLSAITNDDGFNTIYVEQLKNLLELGDVVVAISVHGGSGSDKAGAWSQNLLAALQYARTIGAKSIGIAGFDGGAFKTMADVCIITPVNSTPHVESWHVALEHLITSRLKEMISKA